VTGTTERDWHIYRGAGEPHDGIDQLPPAPPWRHFDHAAGAGAAQEITAGTTQVGMRPGAVERARAYRPGSDVLDTVNAALFLRRPLLVTGKPGTGKSTLAYSIAYELRLGQVLYWPVTSRSTLTEALYRYDAIGRLQEANLRRSEGGGGSPDIGRYLRLGPLGTALLPWRRPRVLLIDELDKSDIDLPNDLLNVFEEGQYDIPELTRLPEDQQPVAVRTADGGSVDVYHGQVHCRPFPVVVITNNGEREFPPAFLRRCLSLYLQPPDAARLRDIVSAQLGDDALNNSDQLIEEFLFRRESVDMSTDQLLNLIFLTTQGRHPSREQQERLMSVLLRPLGGGP
jgi:MoxR-like ATPase